MHCRRASAAGAEAYLNREKAAPNRGTDVHSCLAVSTTCTPHKRNMLCLLRVLCGGAGLPTALTCKGGGSWSSLQAYLVSCRNKPHRMDLVSQTLNKRFLLVEIILFPNGFALSAELRAFFWVGKACVAAATKLEISRLEGDCQFPFRHRIGVWL